MRINEISPGIPFVIHHKTGSGGNRSSPFGKKDHEIANFRQGQAPGLKSKPWRPERYPRPGPNLPGAITDVHFAVIGGCSGRNDTCNGKRKRQGQEALGPDQMKSALRILAGMGVVNVGMDGGEDPERNGLFDMAAFARENGLIPNLAVSGRGLTRELAAKMSIFGQVCLLLDGIGSFYSITDEIDLLRDCGIFTAIRYVVGRSSYDQIEQAFRFAVKKSIPEIEFCRVKPVPGKPEAFEINKTTYEQNVSLVPLLMKYSQQYRVSAKIDCSFFPMLCYSNPSDQWWKAFGAFGCEAGNSLLGISGNGMVSGCSFLEPGKITVAELPAGLEKSFSSLTNFILFAPEPCKSCRFLDMCKGGCHAVSRHITGDQLRPDPDCPFVADYLKKHPYDRLMADIRKRHKENGKAT